MNKKPVRSKPTIKPRTPVGLRLSSLTVKKYPMTSWEADDAVEDEVDEWDGVFIEVDELDESDDELVAAIGG